ncbi:hypothetical protein F5I97DRAFT_1849147 [Phlebopus sp. FC_14]|nr:hypothetical protein F5I97DRAFT_1849147 [Phlebopus sp. FC_14]
MLKLEATCKGFASEQLPAPPTNRHSPTNTSHNPNISSYYPPSSRSSRGRTVVQCRGWRKTNPQRRCKRKVTLPGVFCYQHRGQELMTLREPGIQASHANTSLTTPSSSSFTRGSSTKVQCAGWRKTKQGRCERRIRVDPTLANSDSGIRYCYQHRGQGLTNQLRWDAYHATTPETRGVEPAPSRQLLAPRHEPRERALTTQLQHASLQPWHPGREESVDLRWNVNQGRTQTRRAVTATAGHLLVSRASTSSSAPSSSGGGLDTVQCSGTTGANQRCKRKIRVGTLANENPPPISVRVYVYMVSWTSCYAVRRSLEVEMRRQCTCNCLYPRVVTRI